MNGVREEYSIKVKQTSKGIWFCDGLQVISETTKGLANVLTLLMTQVEGVLTNHNYPHEPTEWEKSEEKAKKAFRKNTEKPVEEGGEK